MAFKQIRVCLALAVALSLIAASSLASSAPVPPCKSPDFAVDPQYGALNGPPTIGVWRNTILAFGDKCPSELGGRVKLVVALASPFVHKGTLEDLAARVGAVSATEESRYWSVTDGAWRVLISTAFAVEDPTTRRRRSDFTAKEVLSGKTLYLAQKDTRSTGLNMYSLTAKSHESNQLTVSMVITAAFPDATVQTCIVHLVRHLLNFCSWKDRKVVAADLRRIYGAATADAAAAELDAFEGKWAGKYASIAPAWRRAWQEVIPFFAFDPAIRKIIYTTNSIESLNRVIRKSIKTRGSFPTEDAATKLIYLAIRNFEKGGRNVREWFAARNQFAIMFEERFNA